MSYWEHALLLTALKQELKSRKISYRYLATRMSLSEATVKRLLAGGTCPLDRLIQMCREVNLSLFELAAIAHDRQPDYFRLTQEQENFFTENSHFYWFLHRLIRSTPLAKIQKDSGLDERSTFKYFRALEKLSLIKLGPQLRYQLNFKGLVQWADRGPMVKKHLIPQIQEFLLHLLGKPDGERSVLDAADRAVSKDTLLEMVSELRALIVKYNRKSYQDAILSPQRDLILVSWVMGLSNYESDWKTLIPKI
jgi:hypothetical protein